MDYERLRRKTQQFPFKFQPSKIKVIRNLTSALRKGRF